MERKIRFDYDAARDVYFMYPCWHIDTEEDCKAWFVEVCRNLAPLGHRADCIIVADMFSLSDSIAPVWNRYRLEINERFMRYTVRVYLNARSLFLHSGPNQECAPDIETAWAMIEEMRRKG